MPFPNVVEANKVKAFLLKPATTSHFVTAFSPPVAVLNYLANSVNNLDYSQANMQDLINLSCSDAFLPGSSLTTQEVSNDYHGVTERFAYRRLYDNQADFTFYVDSASKNVQRGYNVIWFFEKWISYIVNEQLAAESNGGVNSTNYFYRVRFPNNYRSDMKIYKFEKDYDLNSTNKVGPGFGTKYQNNNSSEENRKYLEYIFKDAYPTNIASMPVSYESSQLLKCTVSMTYTRYIVSRSGSGTFGASNNAPQVDIARQSNSTSVNPGDFSTAFSQVINNPIAFNSNISLVQ
jgi:hypothetical protein